jgi:hypothetical protein
MRYIKFKRGGIEDAQSVEIKSIRFNDGQAR